jgi:hypothetical protein
MVGLIPRDFTNYGVVLLDQGYRLMEQLLLSTWE